jgi:hypothetical protein
MPFVNSHVNLPAPRISRDDAQTVCALLAARLNPISLEYDTKAGTLCIVQDSIGKFTSLRDFSEYAFERRIAELEAAGAKSELDPLMYFVDHGKPNGFTHFGNMEGIACSLRGDTASGHTSIIFVQNKGGKEDSVVIGPRAEEGEDRTMEIVEGVDSLQGSPPGDSLTFLAGEIGHAKGDGWAFCSIVTGRDTESWYDEPKVTTEITVV